MGINEGRMADRSGAGIVLKFVKLKTKIGRPSPEELERWARHQADIAIAGMTEADLAGMGLDAGGLASLRATLAERLEAIACFAASRHSIPAWN